MGFNPSGLIYGVLAIATVTAAESVRQESYGRLLLASLVTLVLYWLAHAYSYYWARRLSEPGGWHVRHLRDGLRHEASILFGAVLPTVVFVGFWIEGATLESGVTADLWVAGWEIIALELYAGLRNRLPPLQVLAQTAVGAALGLGILLLRIVLH